MIHQAACVDSIIPNFKQTSNLFHVGSTGLFLALIRNRNNAIMFRKRSHRLLVRSSFPCAFRILLILFTAHWLQPIAALIQDLCYISRFPRHPILTVCVCASFPGRLGTILIFILQVFERF